MSDSPAMPALGALSPFLFRTARVALILLIIVMPMEAITAAREIGLISLAALLLLFHLAQPAAKFRPTSLWLPLLIFFLVAAFSLFSAVDVKNTLKELRAETLKGILIFYCGVHFFQGPSHLRQVWGAILAGAAVMSFFGVLLFLLDTGNVLESFMRAGSLHNGFGCFSTYLVSVWPFALLAWPLAKSGWQRWGLAALALTVALAAFFTYSRAAWAALAVQSVFLVFMLQRSARKALGLALLLGLGLLMVFALSPGATHGERWAKLLENPGEIGGSAGDLLALWKHSYQEIKEHPFQGIGLGRNSFSKAFPDFRSSHQPLLWHAHNMFVDMTLQLGVQGLLAFLVVLAVLVHALWPRARPIASQAQLFRLACLAMVLGFCLKNLTDDFFADDNGLLFWLLCGLGVGSRYLTEDEGTRQDGRG